jgi:hypothetical protein
MSDQDDFDAVSRRLARTDFSADSRIRVGLRAALLRKRRAGISAPRVAVLSAALAAAALGLLLPRGATIRRGGRESLQVSVRLPAAPSAPRTSAKGGTLYPRGENGLPVLPGRLAAIATRPASSVVEIHRGRPISRKNGSAVLWEIDGTAYILETRRISLDELFVTRSL